MNEPDVLRILCNRQIVDSSLEASQGYASYVCCCAAAQALAVVVNVMLAGRLVRMWFMSRDGSRAVGECRNGGWQRSCCVNVRQMCAHGVYP